MSLRKLHRILRKLNLFRRHNHLSINDTLTVVSNEITGSAGCFGYRLMCQHLRSKGLNVGREETRMSLRSLDPVGVEQRSCIALSRGNIYLWDQIIFGT